MQNHSLSSFVAISLPGNSSFETYSPEQVQESGKQEQFPTSQRKTFVLAPFANSELPTLWFENLQKVKPSDFSVIELQNANSVLDFPKETSRQEYFEQFSKAKNQLENNQIKKVILSRIIITDTKSSQPFDYFKKLCETSPNTFNYLCYHPSCGLWIGASPEILIESNSKVLKTVALAGTRPAEENPPQWRDKEIEEQKIVSDYIRSILELNFEAPLNYKEAENHFTGSVWHLKSSFEQTLDINESPNFEKLIQQLHPTPAISGLPKEKALSIIKQVEKHRRDYYTGYTGIIENDQINLFVNLRCMRWKGDKAALYLGGGITNASDPEEEWNETIFKANTLLKHFS